MGLVARATGYLGRSVVQELKRQGYWVRTPARSPERLAEPGPFPAHTVRDQIDDLFVGEVIRPETLTGLCDGVAVVFLSIGLTRAATGVMRLFSRHAADLSDFFATANRFESVVPKFGMRTLDEVSGAVPCTGRTVTSWPQ